MIWTSPEETYGRRTDRRQAAWAANAQHGGHRILTVISFLRIYLRTFGAMPDVETNTARLWPA
jgi:hypothetical protein